MFPWHVVYAIQKPFKEELERLHQQDIITPLAIDKMAERCNRLCLDPERLNQVLIRPVNGGLSLNDIFPTLNNVKYLSLIDASSGYHNLKLDERSSYLPRVVCQFARYRYKRLPFGADPTGDMFQHYIDKIFKNSPNVYVIAYDILAVGNHTDGNYYDEMLGEVLQNMKTDELKT